MWSLREKKQEAIWFCDLDDGYSGEVGKNHAGSGLGNPWSSVFMFAGLILLCLFRALFLRRLE